MDFYYTNGPDVITLTETGNYFGLDGDDQFRLDSSSHAGSAIDGGGGVDTLYVVNSQAFSLYRDFRGISLTGVERLEFGSLQTTATTVAFTASQIAALGASGFQIVSTGNSTASGFIDIHFETISTLDLSSLSITSWLPNNQFRIFGTDSAETVTGTDYVDLMFGQGGDDTLIGGDGKDTLFGGDGSDILEGGFRDDVIYGGDGVDYAVFAGSLSDYTIVDNLNGIISIVSNNDYGTDLLIGVEFIRVGGVDHALPDASRTPFTSGDDMLTGQGLHEIFRAGDGNDTVDGNFGFDEIYGEDGNDTLIGGRDYDILDGGNGNDTLYAGDLTGQEFVTSIESTAFALTGNVLRGGEGDDLLVAASTLNAPARTDFLDGGSGFDTAHFNSNNYYYNTEIDMNASGNLVVTTGNVTHELQFIDFVRLTDHIFSTSASAFTFDDTDNLYIATNDSETLDGLDGNDFIYGVGGDDILRGGDGIDALMGGEGNDFLYGGAGQDYLRGDAGDDWLFGDVDDTYIGGEGYDSVVVENAPGRGANLSMTAFGIERAYGTTGIDRFDAQYAPARVDIHTNGGADIVIGGNAGDYFWITNEVLTVGSLSGGLGYDYIINESAPGAGTVTVNMHSLGVEGYFGSAGNEIINAAGLETFATIYSGGGTDTITGSSFNDYVFVVDGNSTVTGGTGFDYIVYNTLDGSGFSFVLGGTGFEGAIGRDGNDSFDASGVATFVTLYGYGGNDTLIGGDGVDAIYGGTGNDMLTGGASQDNFVFYDNWGDDTVTDFADGTDVLIMSVTGLTSFAQLSVVQDGADALISYGGQSIRLTGVTASNLDALNFEFSPPAGSSKPLDQENSVMEDYINALIANTAQHDPMVAFLQDVDSSPPEIDNTDNPFETAIFDDSTFDFF